MKFFVLLTFLVAVSTAFPHSLVSAVRQKHNHMDLAVAVASGDKWDLPTMKQFFLGFATGAVDQLGDVSKCMPEVTDLMNHVQALITDFEAAIHKKSIKQTEAALLELAAALHDISSALNDCGLRAAAMDIVKIYKQIQAGLAFKILLSDAIHIFKNGREFIHWFKNAINAFKVKDYYTAGLNVGEITAFLIKESAHPTVAQDVNNKTLQALEFVEGMAQGMAVTMGDPSLCLTDVEQMISNFDLAFHDLQYGFKHKSLGRIESGITEVANGLKYGSATLSACGFTQAAQDVERIVAEIKNGGVLKVVIEEAVKIFSHGRQVEHLFIGAKDAWLSNNFQVCGNDVGQLVAFLLAPKAL